MAKERGREGGVEVAPLLIIGVLTLVALTLWLWRGSNLQTATRPTALAAVAAPRVATRAAKPVAVPTLRVPVLPAGVIGSHWRERTGAAAKESEARGTGQAVLVRPDGSTLGLTIHPGVQRRIERRLKRVHVPYGAAVLIDIHSGAVRAWAEHREPGEAAGEGQGLTRATAPAASIFKIVTATALLEAGAQPETETCFHGGHGGIVASLLKPSSRDTTCESLAMSLARSSNVAFGKQAVQRLSAGGLTATAEELFFGRALPFDVQTRPSHVRIGQTDLRLARAAAGFVGTSLSPLHGAVLAAAVANDGVMMQPYLVDRDSLQPGQVRAPAVLSRVMSGAVARDLREMMALTLTDGTGRKQFKAWPKSLAEIQVAGKTGTLSRKVDGVYHNYTWFVGFAPAGDPQIAVAALAVNGKRWHIRGPTLARVALTAWFQRRKSAAKTASKARRAASTAAATRAIEGRRRAFRRGGEN